MLLPPASLILSLMKLLNMNSVIIHTEDQLQDLDLESYIDMVKLVPYFQVRTSEEILAMNNSTFKTLTISCGVPKGMLDDAKYFMMKFWSWLIVPCDDQEAKVPPVLRWDSLYFELKQLNDSYFNIEEVYAVKREHTFRNLLGSWDSYEEQLSVKEPSMWRRRRDLKNATISVTGLPFPGSIMPGKKPGDKVVGSMAELMYTLASSLNANLEWDFLPKEQARFGHGSKLKNGSWTGTLGQLQRKEVDVVATGLFHNAQRMEMSEYVLLPYHTKITLIMLDPMKAGTQSKQVNLTAFVAIFSPPAWALVFTAIAILIIFHYIFMNIFVASQLFRLCQ